MSEKVLSPARHEPTDVGGRFIWIGVALVLASVLVLGLLVLWLLPGSHDRPHHALAACRTIRIPSFSRTRARTWRSSTTRKCDGSTGPAGSIRRIGIAHIPIADGRCGWCAQEGIAGLAGSQTQEKPPMRTAPRCILLLLCRAPPFAAAASLPDFSGLAYEQKPGSPDSAPRAFSATKPVATCGWPICSAESR